MARCRHACKNLKKMSGKIFAILLMLMLTLLAKAQYYYPLERITSPKDTIPKTKVWQYTLSSGINGSYTKNKNVPPGTGNEGLAATISFDFSISKDEGLFISRNELHYLASFFKSGESGSTITKTSDNLLTLHDWSLRNGPESNWYINYIARVNTPLLSTYKGGVFKTTDVKQIKIEKFANAYDVNIAPGVKYAMFKKKLNISVSPYAVRLYGVIDQAIADQNVYDIGPVDEISGKAPKYKIERKGAEVNIWFDHAWKEILTFEYRMDISFKYSNRPLQEGLFNGFLTTRLKLIKNLYLTHRGILTGIIEQKPLKPEWRQTFLLSYSIQF